MIQEQTVAIKLCTFYQSVFDRSIQLCRKDVDDNAPVEVFVLGPLTNYASLIGSKFFFVLLVED